MAVVEELIRGESNGSISFGNYQLAQKAKREDFEFNGDVYKVKTFATMTKLEKNGLFVYESVPGTSVTGMAQTADGVAFEIEGKEDAQIVVGLADETGYEVFVNGESHGVVKTGLGGKLTINTELEEGVAVKVEIRKN